MPLNLGAQFLYMRRCDSQKKMSWNPVAGRQDGKCRTDSRDRLVTPPNRSPGDFASVA